jgi:hypothetical protein
MSSFAVGGFSVAFIIIPFLPEAYSSLEVQTEIHQHVDKDELKAYISKTQVLVGGISQGVAMFFGQLMITKAGYLGTYASCAGMAFVIGLAYYLLCGTQNPQTLETRRTEAMEADVAKKTE